MLLGVGVAACLGRDSGRKQVGVGDTAWVETYRQGGPEGTLRRGQLLHVAQTQGAVGGEADEARWVP